MGTAAATPCTCLEGRFQDELVMRAPTFSFQSSLATRGEGPPASYQSSLTTRGEGPPAPDNFVSSRCKAKCYAAAQLPMPKPCESQAAYSSPDEVTEHVFSSKAKDEDPTLLSRPTFRLHLKASCTQESLLTASTQASASLSRTETVGTFTEKDGISHFDDEGALWSDTECTTPTTPRTPWSDDARFSRISQRCLELHNQAWWSQQGRQNQAFQLDEFDSQSSLRAAPSTLSDTRSLRERRNLGPMSVITDMKRFPETQQKPRLGSRPPRSRTIKQRFDQVRLKVRRCSF